MTPPDPSPTKRVAPAHDAPAGGADASEVPPPGATSDPTAPTDTTAPSSADARRRQRTERAREALVSPWSAARARRLRIFALVLVVVGPVLGSLFALVITPSDSSSVAEATPDEPPELDVVATIRNVDATNSEATIRLVLSAPPVGPEEQGSDLFDGPVLNRELSLVVNDVAGENLRTLPEDQAPGSLTATIPLSESRVTRYPLERYQAIIFLQARLGGADGDLVPLRLTVRSNDPLFSTTAADSAPIPDATVVGLRVHRRWTVIGWALFFVLLCWLLAISAASVGWATIVHGIPAPVWSWAFLIGILFALPPLRDSLPGDPPGGSLVDFAAFYWAVGIVALTLVGLAGSWNVRVRRWPGHPESPRPPS